jgi:hypothetical protein
MISNVPPTFLRIITQPADSPILEPNNMAEWWVAGRAERKQPLDSANLEPDSLAVRAAGLRWLRFGRSGKARSIATPEHAPAGC